MRSGATNLQGGCSHTKRENDTGGGTSPFDGAATKQGEGGQEIVGRRTRSKRLAQCKRDFQLSMLVDSTLKKCGGSGVGYTVASVEPTVPVR